MLLGLRAAARELGISHPALLKHEKRGRVTRNSEGLFDVEACRAMLAENTRPSAGRARHQETERPMPAPTPVIAIRSAAGPFKEKNAEQASIGLETVDETLETSLLAIQRQREGIKLEREQISFAAYKGTLVDAEKVKTAVTARASEEREALLNWPARVSGEMAAELNVDERTLYAALEKQIRVFLRERSRVLVPSLLVNADG